MMNLLPVFFVLLSFPAHAAQGAQPSGLSLIPMLLVFVVFYFFIIRPHRKKMKEHETVIEAIKVGDKVITSGGVVGKVVAVSSSPLPVLTIEVSHGVKIEVLRSNVADLYDNMVSAKESEGKKDKSVKDDTSKKRSSSHNGSESESSAHSKKAFNNESENESSSKKRDDENDKQNTSKN